MREVCVLLLMVAAGIATTGDLRTYGDLYNQPPVSPPTASADQPPLTAEQLDDLLSPIALFPDPLLAQILPAAPEPQDIAAAAAWIAAGNNPNQLDDQPWDPSVLAIARYPTVLKMLSDFPDWTDDLGYAFATQQADVTESIQRLRAQAQAAGSLVSSPEQEVVSDQGSIQIVPANPQVIYVPVYDPQVVYVVPPPGVVRPRITFGPALPVGVWFTNDFDWRGGYVVMGSGWRYRRGGVWISVNNSPAFWPRNRYRYWPGWDGRPQPWRPRPGRPPFRRPPRAPIIPGRPSRVVRPGTGRPPLTSIRPGNRPSINRPTGGNRPPATDENRGRPGGGTRPGGGSPAQQPGRPGGLTDIDRPNGGQANSNRGRQSRLRPSAQTPRPTPSLNSNNSGRSVAQARDRGAQSRAQGSRGGTGARNRAGRGGGG